MVDSVTLLDMLLMIVDAVTGLVWVPRSPESVTQIIFEAVEFPRRQVGDQLGGVALLGAVRPVRAVAQIQPLAPT